MSMYSVPDTCTQFQTGFLRQDRKTRESETSFDIGGSRELINENFSPPDSGMDSDEDQGGLLAMLKLLCFIGASLSEPHTSESTLRFLFHTSRCEL